MTNMTGFFEEFATHFLLSYIPTIIMPSYINNYYTYCVRLPTWNLADYGSQILYYQSAAPFLEHYIRIYFLMIVDAVILLKRQ